MSVVGERLFDLLIGGYAMTWRRTPMTDTQLLAVVGIAARFADGMAPPAWRVESINRLES